MPRIDVGKKKQTVSAARINDPPRRKAVFRTSIFKPTLSENECLLLIQVGGIMLHLLGTASPGGSMCIV